MNQAIEFINPTKALEYMATATPIVSSPVPDVVSNFASVVQIPQTHDKFIAQRHCALELPTETAIARGLKMALKNTWEAIIGKMEDHIKLALGERAATQHEKIAISPLPTTPKVTSRVLAGSQRVVSA